MSVNAAINALNPGGWSVTSIEERLSILQAVRDNLRRYGAELAASDTRMKNGRMGEALYTDAVSRVATIVPLANAIMACIELYEDLRQGNMPKPADITKVSEGVWDITVYRPSAPARVLAGANREVLRVKGDLKQVNPMTRPGGIVAVLGAGNYSSAIEVINALFLDNCTVVHKPHEINAETDRVWVKVLSPLVERGALSFVEHDQGRELTTDQRITKIYFTGGSGTAQAIMSATDTPLISECGGNNPCIIVPGDRPWTKKEIEHQAQFIASGGKMNGGAVCARPQTIVTSKHWPQREEFMKALRKAIVEDTPAAGTYYPHADKVEQSFLDAYPDAEVLKPEGGKFAHTDYVLIPDADPDGFLTENEAFCQIMSEVALDVPANADAFLPAAVQFSNEKLTGTLAAIIFMDEDTKKSRKAALDQAITDLEYGAITVNEMPATVWYSPYLTWGGNEEGKEFVSGVGNFGNALCFENVEKSVLIADFMSPGHAIIKNKAVYDRMSTNISRFSVDPSWMNLVRVMGGAVMGGFGGKDF